MIKTLLTTAFLALIFTGCAVIDTPDSEGWKPSQKKAFLSILENDTYVSICGQQSLYKKVRQSEDSHLMTRLLIAYANNLANSCIDLDAFNRAQEARKSDKFKTHFTVYKQKVDPNTIKNQLKAGYAIEQILKSYIPPYREFERLVKVYRALEHDSTVSAETRYKVRLNIERVKLMKPNAGKSYALVNIPEYRVRIIENGKTVVSMKVVVGKYHMQTPVFGEDLQYIVLNPQWNVPDSIARNEIIPKYLKRPGYLKSHRMVVRKNYNLDSPEVKLSDYNLTQYVGGKGDVPFKFIEVPSKKNGLGRVKFLFPNKHAVYMHDTQSKYLFARKVRTFSHGCVRLERPKEMLKYIIEHYTNLSWEEAKEKYDSLKTHYIAITKRLPVHTAYFTTYIDDDGTLRVFKDIYGYDRLQKLKF
ncbi:MAG: L,D-transpeptidase family protein [Sulfurovum sp.]|nr:L,D-transpeptidase family protein [Sulfurovum sp.]